jgi:signal transduction histidine kinase
LNKKTRYTIALAVLLTTGIFFLDWVTPFSFAPWFLYIIPLLITSRLTGKDYLLPTVLCFLILILIDFIIQAPSESLIIIDALNRLIGGATLVVLAFALRARNKSRDALSESKKILEQLVEDITESRNRLRFLASELLKAQEKERRRIAGDLHDSLGTSLNVLKFRVEEILQKAKSKTAITEESLGVLFKMAQENIEEVRRIQLDLRPPMLDDLGLLPTVAWLLREFRKTYSRISIEELVGIREEDVTDSLKTTIFRILQEALNNITKHSTGNLVRVFLVKRDETLELTVQDNGQGFELDHILSRDKGRKGLGLASMRERAELSGGSFSVHSAKGEGTMIRVSWSLKNFKHQKEEMFEASE